MVTTQPFTLNVNKTNAMIFKWKWARKEDLLNTDLYVCNEFKIKCNGETIPFVE